MRATFKYLSLSIPVLVAFQAAVIALALFGLGKWVEDGNTLTKSAMESGNSHITGEIGFALHGIVGEMLIPLIALVLLVVSFFTKVPGTAKWGAMIFGGVVLQVLLGIFGHAIPAVGLLHGINAILLAFLGVRAAREVGTAAPAADRETVSA